MNETEQVAEGLQQGKVDKGGFAQVGMEMLNNDIKTRFTGGSVAVVGTNSVGPPQFSSDLIDSVSSSRFISYSVLENTHYRDVDGITTEYNSSGYHSVIIDVVVGDSYKLDMVIGGSVNQRGVIFVDEDFKIEESYFSGGAGFDQFIKDYVATTPEKSTKMILSTYGNSDGLVTKQMNYSGWINHTDLNYSTGDIYKVIGDWENVNADLLEGVHYRIVNGRLTESTSSSNYDTEIFDVNPGEYFMLTLQTVSPNQHGFIFADNEGNAITAGLKGDNTVKNYKDELVNVPNGASKMYVCNAYKQPFVTKKMKDTKTNMHDLISGNNWNEKSVIFNGDSITDPNYNSSLSIRYPDYVARKLGMNIVGNYALSGSTVAVRESSPTERSPLVERHQSMSNDADLITIAIGTNDWYYTWTPLGDMDSRDKFTFYGALHLLCLGLKRNIKIKLLCF